MSTPDLFDRIAEVLVALKRRAIIEGRPIYAADLAAEMRAKFPTLQEGHRKADSSHSGCITGTKPTPEAIYQAYPRHVGRKTALKAIKTAALQLEQEMAGLEVTPFAYLLDRVTAYAAAVAEWPAAERQYVPHPSTWMNQGRWADAPSEWKRQAKAAPETRDYSKL